MLLPGLKPLVTLRCMSRMSVAVTLLPGLKPRVTNPVLHSPMLLIPIRQINSKKNCAHSDKVDDGDGFAVDGAPKDGYDWD